MLSLKYRDSRVDDVTRDFSQSLRRNVNNDDNSMREFSGYVVQQHIIPVPRQHFFILIFFRLYYYNVLFYCLPSCAKKNKTDQKLQHVIV